MIPQTETKEVWHPSDEKKARVLRVIIEAMKPLRFTELVDKTKDTMSRGTLVETLRELEADERVEKTPQSHKHVEYSVNPQNLAGNRRLIAQKKILDWQTRRISSIEHAATLTKRLLWKGRKLTGPQRKAFVSAMTETVATAFGQELAESLFYNAKINAAGTNPKAFPSLEELFAKQIVQTATIGRDLFIALAKADWPLTQTAFTDWRTESLQKSREAATTAQKLTINQ